MSPAQPESGSIIGQDLVLSINPELQASDSVEVHDGRTVNAAEHGLVQFLVEFHHAAAQQMCSRSDVQAGVVIRRLDPINLRDIHERDLSSVLDGYTLHSSGNISAMRDPFLGAPECSVKASVIK